MGYYGNQLKALVKRNLLLKRYSLSTTLLELFLPVLMVIIAHTVDDASKTKVYPSIGPTETFDINYAFNLEPLKLTYPSVVPTIGIILPENNKDETVIDKIKANEVFQRSQLQFINFSNQQEMNEFNDNYHNLLIAGIIFESEDYFHYTIRVNGTVAPNPSKEVMTDYALGRYLSEEFGGTDADLYLSIFSPIQAAIDESIIQLKTKDDTFKMQHYVGKLGKAACIGKQTENNGGNLGYFVSNIFIIPICVIVINIVKEKEDGIKDGLLMSGVHPTIFWLSWLVVYILFTLSISTFVTIFFYITKTFENIHPLLLFVSLFLYGLSCSSLGFIFSTFFKRNKTAGTTVAVIVVAISCSNMLSPYFSMLLRKILSLFLCPITIGSLIYEVDEMGNRFENLTFENLFHRTAGYFFVALIINNIIYFFLAIVLDNIFANEGSRYLTLFKRNKYHQSYSNISAYEQDIQEDFNEKNGEKCRVEISHIHKIFKKGKNKENNNSKDKSHQTEFLAVNDISFKVYQNEIFAILGHNGAGKTTLINMMIGLLRPSSGDVYFDGQSISKNKNDIRKDFGVCAQNNTIFDLLTVEQHIKFYAELKNITVNIDEVLRDIDLIHQKKLQASKLSGGQKRKLCIGMATLGNPKYVFLDEPTTGLDPLSRRKIWDLLMKKKKGRVIFLTTHYMDEADILADRKLIISKGKIRCLGTSLYLMNHFNMNYELDVETKDKDHIHTLITNYIPEATYTNLSNQSQSHDLNKTEIQCHTWKLPMNDTNKFTPLLNDLDQLMDDPERQGLVMKYALNMPTLEELFIHLEDQVYNQEDKDTSQEKSAGLLEHIINTGDAELPKLKNVPRPNGFRQMTYLIKSRLKIFLTDKAFVFLAMFFPALINGVMFLVSQKLFMEKSDSAKMNVISIPTMYNEAYFNVEPESQLSITTDNIISALDLNSSNTVNTITNLPLNEIPNPKGNEKYYLSSVNGQSMMNEYHFQIHYNDTMTHAIPATFNALSNAILDSKSISERIVVTSHLYDTQSTDASMMVGVSISGFMLAYCIVANINRFGPLIVRERELQIVKQLQLNGVSHMNYWISCFVTDIFLFLSSCILIFIVGVLVRFEPLMDIKILGIIFCLLLVWSIPTLLHQYVISFIFNKEESAFSAMPAVNTYPVIFGYLIFIIIDMNYGIFDGVIQDKGIIDRVPNIYNVLLTICFPAYGLVAMINSLFTMKIYENMVHYDVNFSHLIKFGNGISPVLIVLVLLSIIFVILLIQLDIRINQTNTKNIHPVPSDVLTQHIKTLSEGDDNVYREYEFVKEHQNELPLSVLHLSKEYKMPLPKDKEQKKKIMSRDPLHFSFGEIHKSLVTGKYVKTAVIDVNFGIRNHECFGLLGPNGAGKSTTLNTITATLPQTTGKICFNGKESHLARLGELSMGYCPQNDILWKELTLREHLILFLRIRGYSSSEAKTYAAQYIRAIGLEDHQNKRADNLSGGTKRKLSLLIAICGYPQQIFLDEPSAGMDPSTRRLVWETIKKTKNMNDSAVIMTTHSMEEAENLCDRLAILVNGQLSCIGSPDHLKMKFGDNYILELQSSDSELFHSEIIEKAQLFKGNEYSMEKSSLDRVKYKVKMTRHLGEIFETMEKCKSEGLVKDYIFNQTSLEQIFINFAKQQIINTD